MNASRKSPVQTDAGQQPVSALKGVGPALASALARLGLEQVRDIWFHLPMRYEDRTRIVPVSGLLPGTHVLVEGVVEAVDTGFRFRRQLRVAIVDEAGDTLLVRFFHFHRGQADALRAGTRLRCFGEVRIGQHGPEMVHPQYWRVAATTPMDERLTPVYPSTEGLGQKRLTRIVDMALECLPDDATLELVPEPLRAPLGLGSLRKALLFMHHPPAHVDASELLSGLHPALQRLAFEELLAQHLALRQLRVHMREYQAPSLPGNGTLQQRFVAGLPFALTGAQRRVTTEIADDMAGTRPMLRLVQGDVGSGKTVVAALAALAAIESGCQVALMAPTELLAEQHLRNFQAWLEPLGVNVAWLSGRVQGRARKAALAAAAGDAGIVIGTHALMQEGVEFANLGLVIIDEQHRFGVHQRLSLRNKGREGDAVPHQLVLTATPIPRTLAMSAYADLDVSSIDEMPPGRTPVQTVVVSNARRDEVMQRICSACAEGRQAYWVCTLIEESEQLEAQAAEVAHAELDETLSDLSVRLVHGRMKASEKQAAMDAFQRGETAVLVATTVIEVGVDVPNASLMVIENAERLGLAQLHQLRGRVGRGSVASSCVLLYRPPLSQLARQRLQVMRETGDGFRIAEKDLELRGPGEVLGTRQTGRLEFRVADLARDAHLLPDVQRVGAAMLADCPRQAERLARRWIGAATRYADA